MCETASVILLCVKLQLFPVPISIIYIQPTVVAISFRSMRVTNAVETTN